MSLVPLYQCESLSSGDCHFPIIFFFFQNKKFKKNCACLSSGQKWSHDEHSQGNLPWNPLEHRRPRPLSLIPLAPILHLFQGHVVFPAPHCIFLLFIFCWVYIFELSLVSGTVELSTACPAGQCSLSSVDSASQARLFFKKEARGRPDLQRASQPNGDSHPLGDTAQESTASPAAVACV